MGWIIVDPKYATKTGTKVARVGVPAFIDETDYEGIVGRAFEGEQFREWRESGGTLILATDHAYAKLEQMMASEFADVPESAVREETTRLAMERQAVVLMWVPTQ